MTTEGQEITSHVELRQQLVVRWPCRSKASPADVRGREREGKTRCERVGVTKATGCSQNLHQNVQVDEPERQ